MERPRMTHELKTWPEFFTETRAGRKKFELRRNDRDFQVGDQLLLKEWNPKVYARLLSLEHEPPSEEALEQFVQAAYTGRELLVRVDYIMDSWRIDEIGLEIGDVRGPRFVIMSISLVS